MLEKTAWIVCKVEHPEKWTLRWLILDFFFKWFGVKLCQTSLYDPVTGKCQMIDTDFNGDDFENVHCTCCTKPRI